MFRKRQNPEPIDANEDALPLNVSQNVPKRPVLIRLFSIKFWGALRLLLLCVLVGIIQQIGWSTGQDSDGFNALSTAQAVLQNTLAGFGWLLQNGWKPALIGATIVLPIWIIWRLISLPFRN